MAAARGDRYHMVRVRVRVGGHSLDHEGDVGRFLEEQRPLRGQFARDVTLQQRGHRLVRGRVRARVRARVRVRVSSQGQSWGQSQG